MRRLIEPNPAPAANSAILTKATLRAATLLGVTNKVLAKVLGVSRQPSPACKAVSTHSRPDEKSFELAVLFVRLYRSLDAIVGGDDAVAASWLKNRNTVLDSEPLALIQTASGLMNAIAYLGRPTRCRLTFARSRASVGG